MKRAFLTNTKGDENIKRVPPINWGRISDEHIYIYML